MKYNNVLLSCKSLFNIILSKRQKLNKLFSKLILCLTLSMLTCLSWASYTFNMDPGVTEISRRTYGLHMTIFWICVVIGVVVFGVLIYSLIMHRKSIGHKAHDFHENTAVEIIWTIIPFAILIAMAIPATSVLKFIDDKSNSDVLVKITGYQWRWQYEYPEHDISFFSNLLTSQEEIDNKNTKDPLYLYSVDNPLVLPVGKKIRFLFTANDVIHSWWIPKLAIKKDAIPGFINESWVIIDTPGTYRGQCTELCGARHGYMPIVVEAKTEEEYLKWIDSNKQKAKPAEVHSASSNTTTESKAVESTKEAPATDATVTKPAEDAKPDASSSESDSKTNTDSTSKDDEAQSPSTEQTQDPSTKI